MNLPRFRRVLPWLLLAAGLLAPGWLIASSRFGLHDWRRAAPENSTAVLAFAANRGLMAPVAYRQIAPKIDAAGTLFGYEEVSVCATAEGRVVKLQHDVADRIRPGEILLCIDPTDYALAVQQAEKALLVELAKLGLQLPPDGDFDVTNLPTVREAKIKSDNCQSHLTRAEVLSIHKAICDEQLTDKRDDFRVATAEYDNQILLAKAELATIQVKQEALAIARQRLAETVVKAPAPADASALSGGAAYAVSRRSVTAGSYLHAGDEVFRLVIDKTLKLRLPIPDIHANDVHDGQSVEITSAGLSEPILGTVARINPRVDPATRTFEVEVQVPNRKFLLKAGSIAHASIRLGHAREANTAPPEARLTADGQTQARAASANAVPSFVIGE